MVSDGSTDAVRQVQGLPATWGFSQASASVCEWAILACATEMRMLSCGLQHTVGLFA